MGSLYSIVANRLRQVLRGDSFWEKYLRSLDDGGANYDLHVAVMVEPFLRYMLEGRKTIESRFSQKRIAPFNQIKPGDVVLLKKAGGPIVAVCLAHDAWFYRLDPDSWRTIKEDFAEYICAHDPEFWRQREKAAFASLIRVIRTTLIKPITIEKRDRRGWVVLRPDTQSQKLPLYDSVNIMSPTLSLIELPDDKREHHFTSIANYCSQGVHAYQRSRRVNAMGYPVCKYCGADTIDWMRLHQRDVAECDYTFSQLVTDRLHCEWWTKELDATAKTRALKKGLSRLEQAVLNRLTRSIGAANPVFDGRQTPKAGNAIFYAQHALACCCRKCIECWHGVPRGEALDSAALLYFTQLVMRFIKLRMPELADQPNLKAARHLD